MAAPLNRPENKPKTLRPMVIHRRQVVRKPIAEIPSRNRSFSPIRATRDAKVSWNLDNCSCRSGRKRVQYLKGRKFGPAPSAGATNTREQYYLPRQAEAIERLAGAGSGSSPNTGEDRGELAT